MPETKLWMNPINKPDVLKRLSPQQAQVLQMQQAYADAFDTGAFEGFAPLRAAYREERRQWNRGGPEMAQTLELQIPFKEDTVPVRLLRPSPEPELPLLLYLHGGGFVEGDNDTHSLIQRKLAAYSGCVVAGVEYSLSPEVQYPRAVEECAAVCRYLAEHAPDYGLSGSAMGFAGDSGGANLSLAAILYLRDNGFDMTRIKGALLYYGSYGLRAARSAYAYGGPWDGMSESDLAFYSRLYLGEQEQQDCPYFNLYSNDLTRGIPPCFLVAAELDPLCDDSYLLHEVLCDKGIPCQLREYKGALHAFLHYSLVMDDAEDALRRGADFFAAQCGR